MWWGCVSECGEEGFRFQYVKCELQINLDYMCLGLLEVAFICIYDLLFITFSNLYLSVLKNKQSLICHEHLVISHFMTKDLSFIKRKENTPVDIESLSYLEKMCYTWFDCYTRRFLWLILEILVDSNPKMSIKSVNKHVLFG